MHELSLAQRICEIVADHLGPGQRVLKVVVECGPLSGVVPEALAYCFPIAAEAAKLEGAALDLRRLTAQGSCPSCAACFEVDQPWAQCPQCEHAPVTVDGGTEFRLKEIEIDDV